MNLIFPDYPDGNGGEVENSAKKEVDNSTSFSEGCAYTPVMVDPRGVEPLSENRSIQPSPSAACLLGFPLPHAGKQACGSGSFFLYDSFKSKRAVHIYR